MGISSPAVGYSGYAPTDDILQNDATEYVISSTGYVEIFTGKLIEDMGAGSKLRFAAELKDTGGGGSAKAHLYLNGTRISSLSESGGAYVRHTEDLAEFGTARIGDLLSIKVSKSVGGTGKAKNIQICGLRSPVIYD